ncbi:MAG: bifunctional riboflavin kinase/FAD synthetase [Chloroflexi bacterium]|nr:bifunctional riboflavin kinase/FAD synthetase [Chloroflexota bacterium]
MLSQTRLDQPTVLTLGVFDGVHLGHRHLFQHVKEEAARLGCQSAVLTFTVHPRQVLDPAFRPSLLTTLERRIQLLRETGLDLVLPIPFDRELSYLTASEFVALLRRHLCMKGLVVGPDFAMGHRREGTVEALQHMARHMAFTLKVVRTFQLEGAEVRSTAIRRALAQGDVTAAARMLGRPYLLEGKVMKGEGRGRELGFPTANLAPDPSLALPADGIYATWAIVEGKRLPSATSIGTRPTFGPGDRTIETFIIDFHGQLYGQPMSLEFMARLRDEQRFDSVEALVQQMHKDVEQAREVLERS